MLGIYIGNDLNDSNRITWDACIGKVRKILQFWKKQKLSPSGKIVILKSLITPIITFPLQYNHPPQQIKETLEKEIKSFFYLTRGPGATTLCH